MANMDDHWVQGPLGREVGNSAGNLIRYATDKQTYEKLQETAKNDRETCLCLQMLCSALIWPGRGMKVVPAMTGHVAFPLPIT